MKHARSGRENRTGDRRSIQGQSLPIAGRACYTAAVTPIRRQYLDVKRRFPGTIVLFRLGDFYETFDEDACDADQVLA